jgi:preprotein translocase subunit SecG
LFVPSLARLLGRSATTPCDQPAKPIPNRDKVAGSGVATDAAAKLTLSRRAPISPGVLLVKTRAAVVGAPTGSTGAAGQISYAMMTLAPGTYTLSFDLIGSQRGLTTSTTVMLGSLFMALSIVFPIMRSSKKNSRIAREEERTRNTQTRGWIEPKTGCGQTAKGRLVALRSLTCGSRRKREHALCQRNAISARVLTVKKAKHQAEC